MYTASPVQDYSGIALLATALEPGENPFRSTRLKKVWWTGTGDQIVPAEKKDFCVWTCSKTIKNENPFVELIFHSGEFSANYTILVFRDTFFIHFNLEKKSLV